MSNSDYAKDVLVSVDWVESHLDELQSSDPTYRLVEVDVGTETYDENHALNTIGFNWESQLRDQMIRDVLTKEGFRGLLGSHGISEDSMAIFYGNNSNWFIAYTYQQLKYHDHENVYLMNGNRDYWVDNDYPTIGRIPSFPEQDYSTEGPFEDTRVYRDDVEKMVDKGLSLVDVRSSEEFPGETLAPPGPQETAQRGGHISDTGNTSWVATINSDGTFKSADELHDLYADQGIGGDESTIAYYHISERSSIAWFVLHELPGYENVTNYDGSWTEWGNLVDAFVEGDS